MVDFLRTNGISHKVEEIIINAKDQLTFISPYLKFPKMLYERIQEKADEGVKIRFVYGKSELSKDQDVLLRKLKNTSIFYLDNLHAKCYLNEGAGIITSMNLYDFSEKNNREMGIHFDKASNEVLYNQVNAEIESIIKASVVKSHSQSHIHETPPIQFSSEGEKPKKHSFLSKLMKELVMAYRLYTFTCYDEEIRCLEFGKYFYLEILYRQSDIRVDFRLRGKYNEKSDYYKYLESQAETIYSTIPKSMISWGNQMKRIKIDIPVKYCQFDEVNKEQIDEYLRWIMNAKDLFETLLNTRT
jgi:HKD family nuclease